jgi:hypothetical protein
VGAFDLQPMNRAERRRHAKQSGRPMLPPLSGPAPAGWQDVKVTQAPRTDGERVDPAYLAGQDRCERLLAALALFAAVLDEAHAAGQQIPPMAQNGIAQLTMVAHVLEGQTIAGPADVADARDRLERLGLVKG